MRLANKVAIITGGGSGIGRATAYLFAEEGAKVVVAQRTDAKGEETVAGINSRGGQAIFVHTDVTIAPEVEHLIRITADTFGKIDVLFINAGIRMQPTAVETIDEALWDTMYATNVKSIFLTAKYAVPEMKRAGGGVIINNASISGVRPRMYDSVYSSSKGAVIALTKALALELAPDNIRVNCISPVATDTPMIAGTPEERKQAVLSTIPLGRIARPEDIAYAALYLASDESAMLTGTNLKVDGGRGI